MISATYRYYVDWNGDGWFGSAGEDISGFVFEASWEYGRDYASQLGGRSKAGSCRISLDNSDSLLFAEHVDEDVLGQPPIRQYVVTIPKMLRLCFNYDRQLLGESSR